MMETPPLFLGMGCWIPAVKYSCHKDLTAGVKVFLAVEAAFAPWTITVNHLWILPQFHTSVFECEVPRTTAKDNNYFQVGIMIITK